MVLLKNYKLMFYMVLAEEQSGDSSSEEMASHGRRDQKNQVCSAVFISKWQFTKSGSHKCRCGLGRISTERFPWASVPLSRSPCRILAQQNPLVAAGVAVGEPGQVPCARRAWWWRDGRMDGQTDGWMIR